MKMYGLFQALMILILLACLSGVQGQYSTPTSGYSTAAPVSGAVQTSQYSQFYQMLNGPVPSNHIGVPQQYDIIGNLPSTVLFSNQGQPVSYSQYASSPSFTGASSLWIQGSTSWTQSVVVPQGATVNLLAITPTAGSGYSNFMDADGQTYTYNYYFYPYSLMTFYADKPGRHIISFVVNGMVSNQVIIDVTGTYVPPTDYLPPAYYPGYYGYYPGYFGGFDYFPTSGGIGTTTGGQVTGGNSGDHTGSGNNGGNTGDHTGSGNNGGNTGDHTGNGNNGGNTGDHTSSGDKGSNSGNHTSSGDKGSKDN